jgi:hypothetical protein
MSQEWWLSPELAMQMRMGSGPAVAVAGSSASGPCGGPLGNEFSADNRNLARGVDSEPYLATFEPDDRHADVVADKEFFHQLPRQHQHGTVPLGRFAPRFTLRHRSRRGIAVDSFMSLGHVFWQRRLAQFFASRRARPPLSLNPRPGADLTSSCG